MSRPLFCPWQENIASEIEKKRITAIASLGLAEEKSLPIFDEATQTIADSLNFPICCFGIVMEQEYIIKSAYGLSHLGLMNNLAKSRKIIKQEAFGSYVIDSGNILKIENTLMDSFFSQGLLSQQYGIVSYLGVPLILNTGESIGCLEVFDTKSRQINQTDINFLMISSRWCISEYERSILQAKIGVSLTIDTNKQNLSRETINPSLEKKAIASTQSKINSEQYIRDLSSQLLNQLTQKLSIPLTSIIGMSSVLKQGIYGKLNNKQIEYLQIIHDSGQQMSILVDEILKLTSVKTELNLEYSLVDLENLGQQVIQSVESNAQNKEHSLKLSIEPGEKIWNLDREKVKKTLYYLLNSIIEGSRSGGEINIHISRCEQLLKVICRVNHPWLGEGISLEKVNLYQEILDNKELRLDFPTNEKNFPIKSNNINNHNYDLVCLSFSAHLAHLQGGNISLQGSVESGYRFLLSIPIP